MRRIVVLMLTPFICTASLCQTTTYCRATLENNLIDIRCEMICYPRYYEMEIELSQWTKGKSKHGYLKKNRLLKQFIKDKEFKLLGVENRFSLYRKSFLRIPYTKKMRHRIYTIKINSTGTLPELLEFLNILEVKEVTFKAIPYAEEVEIMKEVELNAIETATTAIKSSNIDCADDDIIYSFDTTVVQSMPPTETYYVSGHGRKDTINQYIDGIRMGIGMARVEEVHGKPWNEVIDVEQFQEDVRAQFQGKWSCRED